AVALQEPGHACGVPAVHTFATQLSAGVNVLPLHEAAAHSAPVLHSTHLPLPSQTLSPLLPVHAVPRDAFVVSQQPLLHVLTTQADAWAGQSVDLEHAVTPIPHTTPELLLAAELALVTLVTAVPPMPPAPPAAP